MIKKIIIVCLPITAMLSGNALGLGTGTIGGGNLGFAKCCSGTKCANCVSASGNVKGCLSDADCGGATVPQCPDDCPNTTWTLVDSDVLVLESAVQYEIRCNGMGACVYRCHSGSYGNPTSSDSGCTRCPLIGTLVLQGMIGPSSPAYGSSESGATNITDCYAPAGEYKDDTGKFKFTEVCAYSE